MTRPTASTRLAVLWTAAPLGVIGLLLVGLPACKPDPNRAASSSTTSQPAYDSHRPGNSAMANRSGSSSPSNPAGSPTIRQGPCFRYAVPAGWKVLEDGQFAVVLQAPDQRAITTMVGNVGLPANYDPARYVSDRLAQTGMENVRFGAARQAAPVFGFPSAWDFDVDYSVGGIACRGVARCSVAPNYDFCTMVMTWAASEKSQWPSYASWLPEIAGQVEVTNAAAFGASGVAQQNLQNSIALGEQARRNREASERQWAEVTRQRNESQDRNNEDFRQALGGVQRYDNPFENRPVDLPTTNTVYWIHLTTGQILGDPNPSFDPRTATDSNWQPMKPAR